jgi:hypothetical protein
LYCRIVPAPVRLVLGVLIAACLVPVASAHAAIPLGVYGDAARFDRLTGQHTQSGLAFIGWDQGRTYGKPYSYFLQTLGERPHIALQTDRGGGGAISPRGIALGQGDAHLLGLAQAISAAGKPVLLRPLGEMNNSKNPYCYVTPGGRRRGATHLPRWYRKAFQRIYIVMHGGTAAQMSARLSALGLPGVSQDIPANPYPQLTIVWNPLAVGEPDVRGNHYRDYLPGLRYLDAYGNNYYNFSGVYSFVRTTGLYKAFPSKPFVFPEWGLKPDDPGYIRAFAAFVRGHRRVRFIGFYNGRTGGPLDLGKKPRSLAAYRRFIVPLSR